MIKYFCDVCGEELTKFDNVAQMLDMIGKVYCIKHLKEYTENQEKHRDEYFSKWKRESPYEKYM
jgi:hypothetical protein